MFVPSRVFAWPKQAGARGYLVRFFREGRRVFQRQTAQPRITLPKRFRFAPGRYRWTVVPIAGTSSKPRYGPPIVASSFVVRG